MPTVAVPVYTDQPLWASRVAALDAGPGPIPYKKLTAERLGEAINQAVNTPSYAQRAEELAARIATEDGTVAVVEALRRL
jgi:UDP:flavonoid glycosyltransferase YjiC (YdhE family)